MPISSSCRPDEAAAIVDRADTLAVPLGPGQPIEFMHALGRRDDWVDLRVFAGLLVGPFSVFTHPAVQLRSGFFGPVERALASAGHDVVFIPADFRRFETVVREFRPRVVATAASPPDAEGRFSLSLHSGAMIDELRSAVRDPNRKVIVETSPNYPRTMGMLPEHPHSIGVEEIDLWIEGDASPLELPDLPPGEVELEIARHITPYIANGTTLQTGIGGVPNAVVQILASGEVSDLGIHSEMFTTGLMKLHKAGKITNNKGVFDGVSITTFAMGSRELYDWLDENEDVRFLPVDIVNSPAVIAQNRGMISINGALSVDLFGQVVADHIGHKQHSGIGGHEDFLAGTSLVEGGRSLLCLPSTAQVKGKTRSRIVSQLEAGSLVTSPRHQVDVVVSEFGAAELAGRSEGERALALAEIAHPDWRDELREAARALDRGHRIESERSG